MFNNDELECEVQNITTDINSNDSNGQAYNSDSCR